jgi:hypothetical protein
MRQKIFCLALLFAVLLAGSSCNLSGGPDFGKGTLTLLLPGTAAPEAAGVSRSVISYADRARLTYKLTLTGPGETKTLKTGGGRITVSLNAGEWTIAAEAYDPDYSDDPVGSGSESITVIAGRNSSVRIPMEVDRAYELSLEVFYIHNEADLRRIGAAENGLSMSAGYVFRLENDIVLTNWTPIGGPGDPFEAVFDGQQHSITIKSLSGPKLDDNSGGSAYLGLFAYVDGGALISNVKIKYELAGGTADISSSAIDASPYANVYAGGAAGYANNAFFTNIQVSGKFSIESDASTNIYVGGIAGQVEAASSVISTSYTAGIIKGTGGSNHVFFGGIAGRSDGNIENCYAWADICSGSSSSYQQWLGGIAGWGGTVSKCYAAGTVRSDVSGGSPYVGGIAGEAGDVNGCMSLVSELDGASYSTYRPVYKIGNTAPLTGNYSRNDTVKTNASEPPDPGLTGKDGEGRPLADFKGLSGASTNLYTIAGWDFTAGTGVWQFLPAGSGYAYPVLSWQDAKPEGGPEEAPGDGFEIAIEW